MVKKQQGSLLIEALISVLVLAIGILALGKLQAHFVKGNSLASQRMEASNMAQMKIEELRSYGGLTGTAGVLDYDEIVTANDTVTGPSAVFTRTWTVTDNTSPDYKAVNLVVTWTTQDNESQNVTLSTVISKVDPGMAGVLLTN